MQTKDSTPILKALSISPSHHDHVSLQAIVDHSRWKLFTVNSLSAAVSTLQEPDISVVLCERDLVQNSWSDVLERTQEMPCPPSLIVTSRMADERLWVEALNLGAWDVLSKPFDRTEVLRSVKGAWQHWQHQRARSSAPPRVLRAVG